MGYLIHVFHTFSVTLLNPGHWSGSRVTEVTQTNSEREKSVKV